MVKKSIFYVKYFLRYEALNIPLFILLESHTGAFQAVDLQNGFLGYGVTTLNIVKFYPKNHFKTFFSTTLKNKTNNFLKIYTNLGVSLRVQYTVRGNPPL